jgi:hypothetical protein
MIDSDYVSPDGELRFIVRLKDGDVTMGFDGYPWHTHGDILAAPAGSSAEARAEQFVDALLSNRSIIAVLKEQNAIKDIWITDDPAQDKQHLGEGELVEFRVWGGSISGVF